MTDAALPPPAAASPGVIPPAAATPPPAPPPAAPGAPAVARPRLNLDPATLRQTLIVAGVIAGLFFGSQILNEALPSGGQDQVKPGNPIAIGPNAQVTPLEGWVSSPHQSGSGIVLEKGVVALDLYPETFGQNAGDLAAAYLDVLKKQATQLTASNTETASSTNGSAARFTYQGIFGDNAIEGEVTAIVVGGQAVIADAWSRQGSLSQALGEVHQMIQTIEVK